MKDLVGQEDVKPTRASARIKERRRRSPPQPEQPVVDAPAVSPITAVLANKNPQTTSPARKKKKVEATKEIEKPKNEVASTPPRSPPAKSLPAAKKTNNAVKKAKKEATSTPSNSPSKPPPAAKKKKIEKEGSPPPKSPRPSKKAPPLPCRKPPYPFYSPTETPSFAKGMESVVHILRSCRNIAVLTGAGISVSCGVPDFRSKGVGLYSVLDCAALGLSCPEELFDWEFFSNNPHPFFQFAKKLYFPLENNQKVRPSDSHKLLRLLQDRKQLLRVYSQNIDGLEEEAGVMSKKVVYAHGSLKWATCLTCKRKVPADELEESILNGAVPYCPVIRKSKQSNSSSNNNNVTATSVPTKPVALREPSTRQRKRPRSLGNEGDDGGNSSSSSGGGGGDSDGNARPLPMTRPTRQCSSSSSASSASLPSNACGGVLKPNVTFFGQTLPDSVSRCLESDRKKVDALIVIGTSLSVAPISKVIGYLPANIPRILINRTIVHPQNQASTGEEDHDDEEEPDFRDDYVFDAYLLGNCDDVTRALVKKLRAEEQEQDAPVQSVEDDLEEMGRLLSEVRAEEEEQNSDDRDENDGENDEDSEVLYRAQDWETATVPAERVFLFPGAQPPTPSMEEPVQLQEVCHCNECSKRILKGHIHKCLQCFDYDLCHACYPKVSKSHYEGQHQFGKEKVQIAPSR